MPVYPCSVLISAGTNYQIEADSPEEAAEKAEELFDDQHTGLCHQCSKETDLEGCYGVLVSSVDGTQVLLETDHKSVSIVKLTTEIARLRMHLAEIRDTTIPGDVTTKQGRQLMSVTRRARQALEYTPTLKVKS